MFITNGILLCKIFYPIYKDIKQIDASPNKKRYVVTNIQCLNFNLHIQLDFLRHEFTYKYSEILRY